MGVSYGKTGDIAQSVLGGIPVEEKKHGGNAVATPSYQSFSISNKIGQNAAKHGDIWERKDHQTGVFRDNYKMMHSAFGTNRSSRVGSN
jgi:hypothetical protein